MKKYLLTAIVASAAVLALYVGVRWTVHGRFIEHTDDAYLKADTINIASKVPGRIAEVLVGENSIVHAGDALVMLEDNEYVAALDRAEADVAAKRAALAGIDEKIAMAGAQVDAAKAGVKSASASLSLQAIERKRAAALAKDNFATRSTLDKANAALKDSSGRYEGASASVNAAKAQAAIVEAEKEQAAAALKAAQANLALAQDNLANTRILAPKDGVAGNLIARKGQFANVGQRLVSIVPVSEVYVAANFKETQIRRIRPGAKVTLDVDAYPGKEVEGEVENLSPASGSEFSLLPPENATGNFTKIVQRVPVRIRILQSPSDITLLPGMSVTAAVDTRGGDKSATAAPFSPRRIESAAADDEARS